MYRKNVRVSVSIGSLVVISCMVKIIIDYFVAHIN